MESNIGTHPASSPSQTKSFLWEPPETLHVNPDGWNIHVRTAGNICRIIGKRDTVDVTSARHEK